MALKELCLAAVECFRSEQVNSSVGLLVWYLLFMRLLLLSFSFGLSSLLTGCCYLRPAEAPQVKPTTDSRWKDQRIGSVDLMGFFVMTKGESTDNGKLGVKVLDIQPPKCKSALAEFPDGPQVILEFYNPVSHQTLCTATLSGRSNTSIDRPDVCGSRTGISVVGIEAINETEGWVEFDLRR